MDSLEVPLKLFDNTVAEVVSGLTAKDFQCTSFCRKGEVGAGKATQYVHAFDGSGGGLRTVLVNASGDSDAAKTAFEAALADVSTTLQSPDAPTLHAWITTHLDGKSHTAYVNGWRIDLQHKTVHPTYTRIELDVAGPTGF